MEAAPLDAEKLEIKLVATTRCVPEQNSPEQWSQSYPTDHMLTAAWDAVRGWGRPIIGSYSNITLPPSASVFHYATTCFEGMKVYRGFDGKARLFRPNLNAARMLRSAERLCLPSFDPAELEKLVVRFAEIEAPKWAPRSRPGTFFYLRPVLIATQPTIGLQASKEALLYIIALAFPNIDDRHLVDRTTPCSIEASGPGFGHVTHPRIPISGLKLWASTGPHIRSWPGGAGDAKVGANYGPTLFTQEQARKEGFDQVLWLYGGPNFEGNPLVTEAGGSNFFLVWKTQSGETQLITAPLTQGLILPGITRQSIIELARTEFDGELEVVEADYGIGDISQAYKEGRLLEAFAAGTAYFITPVEQIRYKDTDIQMPMSGPTAGKYTLTIRERMMAIQYGTKKHEWARVLDEV